MQGRHIEDRISGGGGACCKKASFELEYPGNVIGDKRAEDNSSKSRIYWAKEKIGQGQRTVTDSRRKATCRLHIVE